MPIIIIFVIAFFLYKDSQKQAQADAATAAAAALAAKTKPKSKEESARDADPLIGANAPTTEDAEPAYPINTAMTNTIASSGGGVINQARMAQIVTMANENFAFWLTLGNDKPKLIAGNLQKVIDMLKLENNFWSSGTSEIIRAQIVGARGKYSIFEFSGKHAGILPIDNKDIYLKILIDEEFVKQMGITAWGQLKTNFPTSFVEYLKFLVRK